MITRKPLIDIDELKAVSKVLQDGWLSCYRGGDTNSQRYVKTLEDVFCDYFQIKHAVAMNSATSCLHAACVACEIKDKEVITTPFTFSASASCILMAGGKVRFSDIEDTYFNLDPVKIPWGDKPRTVIVVHLHGHPAAMDEIMKEAKSRGIKVIEDASQAIGAKYHGKYAGTIGDCGVFSFNQWKPITCGEGGMLVTNDDDIAHTASLVRNHGELNSTTLGYNYRMTEVSAAIMLEQFKKLDDVTHQKIELADYLTDKLKAYVDTPKVAEGCTHVYYTYAIKTKRRDWLQHQLATKGIYFGEGGLKPLHFVPFYGGKEGDYPVAEKMYKRMMFTDIIRPQATFADMDFIAKGIKECLNTGKELVLKRN